MSFSEDALRKKLDALDETQDSIVQTSQWVLFHYRHAERVTREWQKYFHDAPVHKRLPLLYLVNDVVQQSRAKRKTEFIDSFSPFIEASVNEAYKKVPENIKKKIIKIVNVWRERRIFSKPVEISGGSSHNGTPIPPTSRNNANGLIGTPQEKLQNLAQTSQRFQTFYHELLISSKGKFGEGDIPILKQFSDIIKETTSGLNELVHGVDKETSTIEAGLEITRKQIKELQEKQKRLEEEQKLQEQKRLEDLKRQLEEESMVPTYESDSDDDSDDARKRKNKSDDDDSDEESDNSNAVEEAVKSEENKPKVELKEEAPRPKKRLRFAD